MKNKEDQSPAPAIAHGHYRTAHIISRDHQLVCFLNRILYLNGYSCMFSCDGESAVLNLRLMKADLIIVDHDMDAEMMHTVLNYVKTLHPAANLIMTASRALDDSDRRDLPLLPQCLLIKPLQTDLVFTMIRRLTLSVFQFHDNRISAPAVLKYSGECN